MNFIISNFVFPRLHFLFYATLSLIAGISFQFLGVSVLIQGFSAFFMVFAGIFYYWRKGYHQPLFFIIAASFIIGSLLCYRQQQIQKWFFDSVTGKIISLRGTIVSIEKIQNPRFSYRLILEINQIKQEDTTKKCYETIAIYLKKKPTLLVADVVEIKDVEFKQSTNAAFNTYLAKEKISATLFLESFEYSLAQRPLFSINRVLFYCRESLFATLHSKINSETFQLFSSIFLGNRSAVKKQMDSTKEFFKIWGTSHYLARSGLHLIIFVIIWHFILSLMPLTFIIKQLFLIMLILVYALLSWSSISFERALLMILIYKWCIINRHPSHYVHLVILVTAMVLLLNPLQLFFLDFQLSFGLTLAVAWFNHIEDYKKHYYI
jgi:predicted membrane metal-binding protein